MHTTLRILIVPRGQNFSQIVLDQFQSIYVRRSIKIEKTIRFCLKISRNIKDEALNTHESREFSRFCGLLEVTTYHSGETRFCHQLIL